MADIIAALLFAIITATATLGVTAVGFFVFHRNAADRDAQQQERIEYAFFGVASLVIMGLALYLFYSL
jgi:Mn2+/Fe2+ NRAMP family transporter